MASAATPLSGAQPVLSQAAKPAPPKTASAAVQANMATLPLVFEPNQGQAAPAVAYFAHLPNGAISFAQDGATIVIAAAQQVRPQPWSEHTAQTTPEPPTNLRLSWPGANPQPTISAADRLPGYVNYLLGNDPAQWHSNIPTFAALTYHDLYPGIDLRYDGSTSALKGSYLVAPGADPSRIRWRYDDVTRPTIDQVGNLVLAAANTDRSAPPAPLLTEQAPVAWQQAAGGNAPVAVSFAVQPDGSVGFALGAYDHARPLVLDPYVLFGTPLGSTGTNGFGIALDSTGAIYLTGAINSNNLPVVDPIQSQFNGIYESFVTKINPTGTAIVYSTYIGGGDDYGYAIAVDASDQAYITGKTYSHEFPTTPDAFQPSSNGFEDGFISVLTAAGSGFVYSTYFGGSGFDASYDIAVTPAGWATVAGHGELDGFPLRRNLFAPGDGRGFVARFTPAGELDFATMIPGTLASHSVALDGQGNAYVAGDIDQETLPVLHAVQPHFAGGGHDGFLLSLSAEGSSVRFATYLGGSDADSADNIAVSPGGEATVMGVTSSNNLLPPVGPLLQTPPIQPQLAGNHDAFLIRLSAAGTSMKYGTYLGGAYDDNGTGVAIDASGAAYVTGATQSLNFPVSHAVQWAFNGWTDAFLTKINPAGSAAEYSTYLGGTGIDFASAVAANNGTAYISGRGSDLTFLRAINGTGWSYGAFVAVIGEQCMLSFADVPPGSTFYFYIENLACRGIASGYADGNYRAGASLTRGQLAKIVANAMGLNAEISADQQTFTDVLPDNPFWLPIERAATAGIIGGYSCGITPESPCDTHQRPYYRPAVSVTRGQTAKIVARGMGWNEAIASTQQSFADVAPGAVFWLEVERAHAHGAISGYACDAATEGCDAQQRPYYRPSGAVTRAQAAKIVDGSFFPNGDNPASPAPTAPANSGTKGGLRP